MGKETEGIRGIYWVEEKETTWKPKCRWENAIKTNLPEIGQDGVDGIHLAEESGKWHCEASTEHLGSIKCW